MQNFGVTNKEHYGMLWYFWSGQFLLYYVNQVVIMLTSIFQGQFP